MIPVGKRRRFEVEWQDSILRQQGWERIDEALETRVASCLSVGYLLADDRLGMVLASSVHGDDAAGITIIPRRAILSKRQLA